MQKAESIDIRSITSEKITPEILAELTVFCREATADKKLISENWNPEGWEDAPHSLLYCLLKEKRFKENNGLFYMLYANQRMVAVSGVYRSDWAPTDIAIGGVRTCTLPKQRSLAVSQHGGFYHGDHLLPAQIDWARQQGFKAFILTFNETNLWLAKFILRIHQGRSVLFGYKLNDKAKEVYQDFYLYPKRLMIKNTPQWVLIKKLDKDARVSFYELEEKENESQGYSTDGFSDAGEFKNFPLYTN